MYLQRFLERVYRTLYAIRSTDQVAAVFFSDGAAHNGVFPESLNTAARAERRWSCGHRAAAAAPGRSAFAEPGGVASDIASIVQQGAFDYLDGPIEIVAGRNTLIPFNAQLEKVSVPQESDIIEAVKRCLYV